MWKLLWLLTTAQPLLLGLWMVINSTIDGVGAFMGLAKVFNNGENGNPADDPVHHHVIEL